MAETDSSLIKMRFPAQPQSARSTSACAYRIHTRIGAGASCYHLVPFSDRLAWGGLGTRLFVDPDPSMVGGGASEST